MKWRSRRRGVINNSIMNWVQLKGNGQVFFDNGTIKFLPSQEDKDILKKISTGKNNQIYPTPTTIRSSEYFENGSIEFDFVIEEKINSVITVTIGEDIHFGFNSQFSTSLYTIRKWSNGKMEILSQAGIKGVIEPKKEHTFKINVDGSKVVFYIDGVEVCNSEVKILRKQPEIGFRGVEEIILKKLRITSKKTKAFVVMQFTDEYNRLYSDIIKPICEDEFGYECIRGDELYFGGTPILNDITNSIKGASIIIADITPDNPNVFYEVGFSHALNKPTILISDKERSRLPFDISGFRTVFYENSDEGKRALRNMLVKHLENIQIGN